MHVHDIAGLIFQYITLLKSPGGVAEEIFDEMQVDTTSARIRPPSSLALPSSQLTSGHVRDPPFFKALAEMSFNFRDKQNPMAVATNMAFAMQMYPTSHTLLGMYNVPFEFNEAAIREVLDCMTPQQVCISPVPPLPLQRACWVYSLLSPLKVRIMWSSKRHAGQVTKSEPIYGTEYEVRAVPGTGNPGRRGGRESFQGVWHAQGS